MKLYVYLLIINKFFPKLWNRNSTNGIAINPENETALAIIRYSFTNTFWFLSKIWNKTRKNNETNITETTFVSKFLKDLFSIKYSLKNSTGTNNIKIETKSVINDQKSPCPLQLVNTSLTIPDDSKNK